MEPTQDALKRLIDRVEQQVWKFKCLVHHSFQHQLTFAHIFDFSVVENVQWVLTDIEATEGEGTTSEGIHQAGDAGSRVAPHAASPDSGASGVVERVLHGAGNQTWKLEVLRNRTRNLLYFATYHKVKIQFEDHLWIRPKYLGQISRFPPWIPMHSG